MALRGESKSRLSAGRAIAVVAALLGAVTSMPIATRSTQAQAVVPPSTVTGTVWQDTKPDGVRTNAAPAEAGIQGVTVTLYNRKNQVAGTTTSTSNGTYSITPTGVGPWRMEFTNLPTDYVPGRASAADKGSMVRIIAGPSAGNDLPIDLLGDYCQNNPEYVTTCFTMGRDDQAASNRSAVFQIANDARGYEGGPYWTPFTNKATFNQVGATYGMAYQPTSTSWFAGAYMRRFAGFGDGGPGAIYKNGAVFINLADYGIDAGTDVHVLSSTPYNNHDAPAFAQVGKMSLGDIDISVDNRRLYAVDMFTKQLISIPITRAGGLNVAGTSSVATVNTVPGDQQIGVFDIPSPAGCSPTSWRPMGIGLRGTSVFAGGVCSDRMVTIHRLNPATGTWVQNAAQFDVSFARQGGETFNAWIDTEGETWNKPQPMLSDIAFDGQDLVLGLRDRYGDQTGYNSLTTNTSSGTRYSSQSAGDTLRACWNGSSWTLESGGSCGVRSTAQTSFNTNDGPGGGEYYTQDDLIQYNYDSSGAIVASPRVSYHKNMSEGGLATIPSSGQVATTIMDPSDCWSQGVGWFDNGTGVRTQSWQFDLTAICNHADATISPEGFGKSNGMGDIEAICDEAPIEIGNRVWADLDRNGQQGASEPGLGGVVVELYQPDGTTLIATDTTDADGNYVFSSATGTNRGDAKYGLTALTPMTDGYVIKIPASQSPLSEFKTTTATAPAIAPDTTDTDSDSNGTVVSVNGATATFNTGIAGTNDHTIDFGFYPSYSIGNRVWIDADNSGTINGSEAGVDGVVVKLYKADLSGNPTGSVLGTDTTAAGGYYRFDDLADDDYVVVVASSNFAASGPLEGYVSSTGVSQESNADLDGDSNDNGRDTPLAGGTVDPNGIASVMMTIDEIDSEAKLESDVQSSRPETTVDGRSNLTLDFGFNKRYELGNRIYFDLDNDGLMDNDELPIAGVLVKLYAADGGGAPTGAALATATTDSDGYYLFENLFAGRYVVVVDGTNFAESAVLDERHSSTGASQNADADSDVDRDDNGLDTPLGNSSVNPGGTASGAVTIGGDEPTGETEKQSTVTVAPDVQSNLTVDFGFFSYTPVFSLGNRVWLDTDNSGDINGGETGVAGVNVSLFHADSSGAATGAAVGTDITDANGYYRFDNLDGGDYVVVADRTNFVKNGALLGKASSTGSAQKANANTDVDRDDNGLDSPIAAGHAGAGGIGTGKITLGPGNTEPTGETDVDGSLLGNRDFRSNLTVDLGFVALPAQTLGNKVWVDTNNDGLLTAGEKGLAGVCVSVFSAGLDGVIGTSDDEVLADATTDANGLYLFTNLFPGQYIVEICLPDGYVSSTGVNASPTGPFEGADTPAPDSSSADNDDNGNQVPGTAKVRSAVVTLDETEPVEEVGGTGLSDPNADNRSNVTVDFGIFKQAALGDRVWFDENNDGVQTPGERGIAGVKVELLDMGGRLIASATTSENGTYLFDHLTPGGYVVRFDKTTIPAGATFTGANAGADDGLDNDADTEGKTGAYALFEGDRDLTADAGISSTGPLVIVTPPSTTVPETTTTTTTAAPVTVPPTTIVVPTTVAPKPKAGNVTGVVFIDNDRSKEMGSNEFGRAGVTVRILDESGKLIGTTTSDEEGRFNFDVPPGDYVIEIIPPSDLGATTPIRRKISVKGVQVEADASVPGATSAVPQAEVAEFGLVNEVDQLAFTGSSSRTLIRFGCGMVLLGFALSELARRRRTARPR